MIPHCRRDLALQAPEVIAQHMGAETDRIVGILIEW
jgi:hypothetical protein